MPERQEIRTAASRGWARSVLGLLAMGLAGCGVLQPHGAAAQDEARMARAQATLAEELSQPDCRPLAGQRAHLQAVQSALARDGMALRLLGCPQSASGQRVLAVAVLVVDGERAADAVRGPLADGELLDMGSAAPEATALAQRVSTAAQAPADTLSPDVLHNRAWLRAIMGRQGLQPVGDSWLAFTPR